MSHYFVGVWTKNRRLAGINLLFWTASVIDSAFNVYMSNVTERTNQAIAFLNCKGLDLCACNLGNNCCKLNFFIYPCSYEVNKLQTQNWTLHKGRVHCRVIYVYCILLTPDALYLVCYIHLQHLSTGRFSGVDIMSYIT